MPILLEPSLKNINEKLEKIVGVLSTLPFSSGDEIRKITKTKALFGTLMHELNPNSIQRAFRGFPEQIEFEATRKFFYAFLTLSIYLSSTDNQIKKIKETVVNVYELIRLLIRNYFYSVWVSFDENFPKKMINKSGHVIKSLQDYDSLLINLGVGYNQQNVIESLGRKYRDISCFYDKDCVVELNTSLNVILKHRGFSTYLPEEFFALSECVFSFMTDKVCTEPVTQARENLISVYFGYLANFLFKEDTYKEYLEYIHQKDEKHMCYHCKTYVKNFSRAFPVREIAATCAMYPECNVVICNRCNEQYETLKTHKCPELRWQRVLMVYHKPYSDQFCMECNIKSFPVLTCQKHEAELLACCYKNKLNDPNFFADKEASWCNECNPALKKIIFQKPPEKCIECNQENPEVVSYCPTHYAVFYQCCQKREKREFDQLIPDQWCRGCICSIKPKKVSFAEENPIRYFNKELAPEVFDEKIEKEPMKLPAYPANNDSLKIEWLLEFWSRQ